MDGTIQKKKSNAMNIVLGLVIGIVIGYFTGTFIATGSIGFAATQAVCGNDVREQPELCDGGSKACVTADGYAGLQQCIAAGEPNECTFGDCATTESCGDLLVNGNEQCDGSVPTGITCEALGFTSGTLTCGSNCRFDTSACSQA